MCTIAESNVLLRAEAELPAGLKVATDEFREGWNRMRAGGRLRLETKVRTRGWNFIQRADEAQRSGVGDTSQQAIASALKLALRRVDADSNAVEVKRIELTRYPWFVLARVCVHSYRIQEGAALVASDAGGAMPAAAGKKRLPARAAVLFPEFGCNLPMLKEMLIASRTPEARAQ